MMSSSNKIVLSSIISILILLIVLTASIILLVRIFYIIPDFKKSIVSYGDNIYKNEEKKLLIDGSYLSFVPDEANKALAKLNIKSSNDLCCWVQTVGLNEITIIIYPDINVLKNGILPPLTYKIHEDKDKQIIERGFMDEKGQIVQP